MPPPPLSPAPKFWGVFLPVSERVHDTESLVFGSGGGGSGSAGEFVAEVVVREGGAGRKRGVERVLEGWATALGGPCELMELESIKPLAKRHTEVGSLATGSRFILLIRNLAHPKRRSGSDAELALQSQPDVFPARIQGTGSSAICA